MVIVFDGAPADLVAGLNTVGHYGKASCMQHTSFVFASITYCIPRLHLRNFAIVSFGPCYLFSCMAIFWQVRGGAVKSQICAALILKHFVYTPLKSVF